MEDIQSFDFSINTNIIDFENCMKIKSTYFKRDFDLQKAELIGKGTFAQVYRIYSQDINDSLAIRRVKKNEGDLQDIQKQKLINQQLRRVESDNILKIYDIIDQPQIVWYITEYCSGGSLWDALNQCKDNKMNQKDCLQCVLQISKGVQQLHNHRITHRDLKPQNILLKTKYVPGKVLPIIKLADFGLSTQKIIMQTIAGTKQYIAPEQAKFHNYTNAVDVWSLGIILDQILHGTPFYSGEDNKQVFNKILKMPFKVRDDNLRASIKDLLICLLKKKPYQRPIIAVIRGTIQRILQQIANENANSQLTTQLTKKRKTSIENLSIKNQINKSSKNDRNRIISMPIKQNSEIPQNKKIDLNLVSETKKIEKPMLSKDISPRNRRPVQLQKDQSSNRNLLNSNFKKQPKEIKQIPQVKQIKQTKQLKQVKQAKQVKQVNKQLLQSDIIMLDKQSKVSKIVKVQQKQQAKTGVSNIKQQSAIKAHMNLNTNQRITIIKNQKRKLIASHLRKQEYKADIININKYMNNVYNNYKKLSEIQIKVEKSLDFLPNAYLNSNNFSQLVPCTQKLRLFKKEGDFINYLSTSQDYEIRLYKGQKLLRISSQVCENQLLQLKQRIREGFFSQLDLFIDQYIEKVLK